MKKAFTLIELLVVIAIIAILAAILFPVFAQAKMAAKKTQSISNTKQINLGLLLYLPDYDDLYPRNDDCILNSSLNAKFNGQPAGTNPAPWCNGTGSPAGQGTFAFRVNHYGWQKWVLPYIKNIEMLQDPVFTKDALSWDPIGELNGGYQLNVAITGALNTWNTPAPHTGNFAFRDSWLGGSQTAVPNTAGAMILMMGPYNPIVPAYSAAPNASNLNHTTYYPLAMQEHWYGYFYKAGGTGPCNTTTTLQPAVSPYGNVIPIGYVDGHVKVIAIGDFLGKTPTAAQFGATTTGCFGYPTPNGGVLSSINGTNGTTPNLGTVGSWPLWGLE